MPTTRGPFGSTDSCVFERLARDAVEPFLRSRGIEVREDVRRKAGEGESQQLLALLASLGVDDQADKFPSALSGGQQQRVALARALANAPGLILADEPTGNLDSANATSLLALLADLAREQGVTVVMVTHEAAALDQVHRSLRLRDGRLVEDRTHG